MQPNKAHVLVVDDHPLFREGLVVALRREPDLEIVGEAADPEEAIAIAKRLQVDVAVVDLLMPKGSGMSLVGTLVDVQPSCRVLGLSVVDEPVLMAGMLRNGASGYALKTQPPSEIVEAIRQVLGGLRYLPPHVSQDAVARELEAANAGGPLERLTPREREVFDLLIRGMSNEEISTQLFIARRTVETHRLRIMHKLPARSVIEMIRVAARHGALHQ